MSAQLIHKRNLLLVVAGFFILLIYLHRSPSNAEMVGTYVENGIEPFTTVDLHRDGSYTDYSQRTISKGHWHLDTWYLGDELFLTSDTSGSNSYNDQYLLTRKGGSICIERDGDDGDVYWCKSKK